jgi:hypothetical protein
MKCNGYENINVNSNRESDPVGSPHHFSKLEKPYRLGPLGVHSGVSDKGSCSKMVICVNLKFNIKYAQHE